MADIWVVNDYLTCIPNTKTFWHMLLEINGAIDKTNTPFPQLAEKIEKDPGNCDVIIRNATFFRPINRDCKQVVFLQDRSDGEMQLDVCRQADCVIFNSKYTRDAYSDYLNEFTDYAVIPIGINTELFNETTRRVEFQDNKPVGIFVGDYNKTKGTFLFHEICKMRPDINFIYVSKQGRKIRLPNVRNFPGGKSEQVMSWLYNSSDFSIMCSPVETLHLASIEAAACNKPVLGYNTGWLSDYFDSSVGIRLEDRSLESYMKGLDGIINGTFSPREHILTTPFVWDRCREQWEGCIEATLDD